MTSFEFTRLPPCTIDFPLEISPEEIGTLSGPVNTLLKSSYLFGASLETDAIFQSLFDISIEIADVEACGFLRRSDDRSDHWELLVSRHVETAPAPERLPFFVAPAILANHFGKPVILDPEKRFPSNRSPTPGPPVP